MIPPRPTELAHLLLRDALRAGDMVIDATAGNGHDTAFLADCVGPLGKVVAFDIQPEAIGSAAATVQAAGLADRVVFHTVSHCQMHLHVAPSSATAIVFNLGYLPGGDHRIATGSGTTLAALARALDLLHPGGLLSVVCYPGHAEGATEAAAVASWMETLPSHGWKLARYDLPNTRRPAPFLLLARKPDSSRAAWGEPGFGSQQVEDVRKPLKH